MPSTDSSPTLRDRLVSTDAMGRPTDTADLLAIEFPTSNVRAEPGPPSNQNGKSTSKAQGLATKSPKPSSSTVNSTSNSTLSTQQLVDTMTPEEIEVAHILVSMSRSGNTYVAEGTGHTEQGTRTTWAHVKAAQTLVDLANTDASIAATRKAVAGSRTGPEDEASSTDRNLKSIPVFYPQFAKKRQAADTSYTNEQRQTKKRRHTSASPSAPTPQHDTSSNNASVNNSGAHEQSEGIATQRQARSLRKRKADKVAEVLGAPASPKRARFSQARPGPEQMLAPQHTAFPKAKSVFKQLKSAPKSNDIPKPQEGPKIKDDPNSKDAPRSKSIPKLKFVPKQKSTGSSLPSLPVLGRKNKGVKESTAALLEKMQSEEPPTSPEAAAATNTEPASNSQAQPPPTSEPEVQKEQATTATSISTSTSHTMTATTAAATPTETPTPIPGPRTKAPNLAVPPHIQAKHAELMALRRAGRYPPMPTADEMRDPKNPPQWVVGAKAHTVLLHPVPHYKLAKHLAAGQEQPPTELWFVNETTAPPGGVVLHEAYVRRGKKKDVPVDFNSSDDIRDLNKWVTQKLCRWEFARVRTDMYKRKYCDEEIAFLWEAAREWKKEWKEGTGKEDSELNRPEISREMARRLNERFAGKMIRATYNGKQDKEEAARPPREAPGVDSMLDRKGILKELGVPPLRKNKRAKKETEAEEVDVAGADGEEEL